MKKILAVILPMTLAFSSFGVTKNIKSYNENNVVVYNNRAQQENLSRIRVNDFTSDISMFDGKEFTEEEYLEEIKWPMIDSNLENEDLLFDVWDSIIDNREQWEIKGLTLEVPNKGGSITQRISFKAIQNPYFTGTLSFKVTLTNLTSSLEHVSNVISNTILGVLLNTDESSIQEGIKLKNNSKDIIWSQLWISDITETKALISSVEGSLYYTGSTIVTFYIGEHIKDVVNNVVIGKIIKAVNQASILEHTKLKNNKLDTKDVYVNEIDLKEQTAIINANENSKKYTGSIQVMFIVGINLSEVLKNTSLGVFKNPTDTTILNAIININKDLSKNDILIDQSSKTYKFAKIYAKEDSKYFGSVNVNYTGTIETGIYHDSGVQRVDAYNSTQYDGDNKNIYYTPGLGKDALIKSFSNIKISTREWAYDNENGWIHKDLSYSYNLSLSQSTGNRTIYSFKYSGSVNWMKGQSTFSFSWSTNQLNFNLNTWVQAYASAWNAYWARAEARTILTNLSFI
ncbi:hypothetical protein [Spiroplasma culicicola]|uniref:Uncharacterized protein n=1 Tax=Spiroplasma culicicola AES-1 TaxID=1276246 RepID=W6A863_9MOLU|nr:hypothetical protein [Spiroplasma culicicola]AHI53177.1 hypothetical protein SCULI_v1c08370 [Spiroplasma culicicola AES-1]